MKRPLRPEELKVWSLIVGTVRPLPGRTASVAPPDRDGAAAESPLALAASSPLGRKVTPARTGVQPIEPNRRHRMARGREPIAARLDLHGCDQDQARARLEAFLRHAFDDGVRSALVITGKGVQGDGVLRRRAPEWLAAPHLAEIVAGISEAHRRHGGEGALYVALKRKRRD